MNDTKNYYNSNATEYYKKRNQLVIESNLDFFLKNIEKDELILDLGCGSGNHLFAIRNRGYNVIGVDFSEALIKIIYEKKREKIFKLDFSNINEVNKFITDKKIVHIFSSASLLHLSKKDLTRFFNNLDFSGLFFFSLKEGFGEEIDENKRFFSYYQKNEIENILKERFNIIDFSSSEDSLGRDKNWLNWIVKRK